MSELARRSIAGNTAANRVQDQNDDKVGSGPTSSISGLKGIAGLEAKRSKMGFTGGSSNATTTGGSGSTSNLKSTSVPSPFALSVNGSRSSLLNGKNGTPASTSKTSIPTSRSMTLEPARHRTPVPDPCPTPDVFYDPPTTTPSGLSRTQTASPFLSARVKSTGTPLFKPPAPPSQRRNGTPILPHAKPSGSTRSVLHSLPQPGTSNLHLNGNAVAGPSANKRRKTESGTIPVETVSQQSKQGDYADYKIKYTKAFPSFVFCFDAEFSMNPNKRGAAGEKGFSVKECKEGIRRMGGVSLGSAGHRLCF